MLTKYYVTQGFTFACVLRSEVMVLIEMTFVARNAAVNISDCYHFSPVSTTSLAVLERATAWRAVSISLSGWRNSRVAQRKTRNRRVGAGERFRRGREANLPSRCLMSPSFPRPHARVLC